MASDPIFQSLQTKLPAFWSEFVKVWDAYGYAEDLVQRRKRTIQKHFDDLFNDMLGEETKRLNEKRSEIDCTIEETRRLVKELELAEKDDPLRKMLIQRESLTLLKEEAALQVIVADLRGRKAKRMERYNEINNKVEKLVVELGEDPYLIDFDGIPTDPQVDELNRHYHTLVQEQGSRTQKYRVLKSKVQKHFHYLEKQPGNSLEHLLIEGKPDTVPVPLSIVVMKEIEELESNLRNKIEHYRLDAEILWQRIQDLWKRLKTDDEIIAAFEKTHAWVEVHPSEVSMTSRRTSKENKKVLLIAKPSVVVGLQKELSRLEEEKRQNIQSFIIELRSELYVLWENCFVTTESMCPLSSALDNTNLFTEMDYNSELFTEELLEKHEKEVGKWQKYAEVNKKLFDQVTKREEMWVKWQELDIKSDDPSRLANRGGALLKEEKERKTLGKAIPKMDKELTALSEKHEKSYGLPFFVFGEEISTKITREWEIFYEEKDARKNARKKPDDGKSMFMTSVVAPGSRKRPAAQTPSSTANKTGATPKRGKMVMSTPKSPYGPVIPTQPTAAPQHRKNVGAAVASSSKNLKLSMAPPLTLKRTSKIVAKPPIPPNKKYAGVAVVRKYRKSMVRQGRRRSASGTDIDKTLSYESISTTKYDPKSFSPVLDIHTMNLDFQSSANSIFASKENRIAVQDVQQEVVDEKRLPKRKSNAPSSGRFLAPTPRAPIVKSATSIPVKKARKSLRLQNKEQVPQKGPGGAKLPVISPTYSEFSKDLLGQSALNSSVTPSVAIALQREPLGSLANPTTPTRSRHAPPPKMTPAKSAVPFNNKF